MTDTESRSVPVKYKRKSAEKRLLLDAKFDMLSDGARIRQPFERRKDGALQNALQYYSTENRICIHHFFACVFGAGGRTRPDAGHH